MRFQVNATIQPIETTYKGYRFRSRLEARWAVFFDTLGIIWEYEKEGYNLGAYGCYLPDFWLPTVYLRGAGRLVWEPSLDALGHRPALHPEFEEPGLWLEVKPASYPSDQTAKFVELGKLTGHPVMLGTGMPGSHNPDEGELFQMHPGWDDHMEFMACSDCHAVKVDYSLVGQYRFCPLCRGRIDDAAHEQALIAARGARFERGESGLYLNPELVDMVADLIDQLPDQLHPYRPPSERVVRRRRSPRRRA